MSKRGARHPRFGCPKEMIKVSGVSERVACLHGLRLAELENGAFVRGQLDGLGLPLLRQGWCVELPFRRFLNGVGLGAERLKPPPDQERTGEKETKAEQAILARERAGKPG